MTIDALIDPSVHVLARASARPEVQAAMNSAIDALTRLRFHEGLRRGWEEARAEATIHEATALSLILGARTSVNDLRLASLAGVGERLIEGGSPLVGVGSPYADTGSSPSEAGTAIRRDPAMDLAIGIQRSQTGLVAGFPPLNSKVPPRPRQIPLPALVASIHRDICSGLVESGRMSTRGVAMPKSPEFLAPLAGYLSANAPALARAAAILAHFRFREVFDSGLPGSRCGARQATPRPRRSRSDGSVHDLSARCSRSRAGESGTRGLGQRRRGGGGPLDPPLHKVR